MRRYGKEIRGPETPRAHAVKAEPVQGGVRLGASRRSFEDWQSILSGVLLRTSTKTGGGGEKGRGF